MESIMNFNKNILKFVCLSLICGTTLLQACPRGDAYREYHKNNPNPYVFYEDYLKAMEEQKQTQEETK